MKLNLGCGPHQLEGFDNLNPPEWRFEDGLSAYPEGSVEACSISHALMYLQANLWAQFLTECFRVLQPGGILRITEDNTEDQASERFGGWHDAVTLTGPTMLREQLKAAGFKVRKHTATSTGFHDRSLLQAHHGPEPKVFFIEGRKP